MNKKPDTTRIEEPFLPGKNPFSDERIGIALVEPPTTEAGGQKHGPDAVPGLDPVTIGPYRIVGLLGEGGMGTVYEAEQSEPLERTVALKVIRRDKDSREVWSRFDTERQALAMMEHPSIAKVFDAGTTPAGQPYFAMELVHGPPLGEYCDREWLSLRERLELFRHLCSAVEHAHQKGVIHRDLKPSNVLVETTAGSPRPKVIDFGIARALESGPDTKAVTQLGRILGTPRYMSPEQRETSSRGLDTRTDIYSLGVMLYELLAGTPPHDDESPPPEPIPPSRRFSQLGDEQTEIAQRRRTRPAALKRMLKGDLDRLATKAIAPEREERYATANALALDIERYLNSEPILARGPSATYRVTKFVRRHWVGALSAATVLIALLVGLGVATHERQQAIRAERVATAESRASQQVADFMIGLFDVADPWIYQPDELSARDLLDQGAEEIETALEDPPLIRARLLYTMGAAYSSLGSYDRALAMLEEAREIQSREGGRDSLPLAATLNQLGTVYQELGRFREAELVHLRSLTIHEDRLGPEHPAVVGILGSLGTSYGIQEKFDESQAVKERALALAEKLEGPNHPSVAMALHNLAINHAEQGKLELAVLPLRRAVAILEAAGEEEQLALAQALGTMGLLQMEMGRLEEAEAAVRRSLQTLESAFGLEHPMVAKDARTLGFVVMGLGRLDEARDHFQRALSIEEGIFDPDSYQVAYTRHGLAMLDLAAGRPLDAERSWREILPIVEERVGILVAAEAHHGLASILHARGELEEAERLYLLALGARREIFGETGEPTQETAEAYAALRRNVIRRPDASQ